VAPALGRCFFARLFTNFSTGFFAFVTDLIDGGPAIATVPGTEATGLGTVTLGVG
jgi:hypothetical protein